MAKKATDFRYNTGETRVPWAAVGENYNADDLLAVVKFLMQGEGAEYDAIFDNVKKGQIVCIKIIGTISFSADVSTISARMIFIFSIYSLISVCLSTEATFSPTVTEVFLAAIVSFIFLYINLMKGILCKVVCMKPFFSIGSWNSS